MKRLLLLLAACAPDAMSDYDAKLANGTTASPQTRPWATFLEIRQQNGGTSSCSGTLVAPTKVLTAAHCVVCAQAIDARMIGASTVHKAARWDIHPEAFPDEQMNCSLGNPDPEGKINVGADLAVVTLTTSSSVTPISVVTTPPYGWNPLVATPTVTILGRGRTPSSASVSTMREGNASLDALSNTQHAPCDDLPDSSTLPFLQLWNSGSEAAMQAGDSGGPMIATFGSTPKVIGVASWYCDTSVAYYPPTFAAETAPFLASAIGMAPVGGDLDDDHVLDAADNCAGDPNTTQADADGDHVGDVCDLCPSVADPDQANCNAEAEIAENAPARGDACDPTKCATIEMQWGQVPTNLIPQPAQPCALNGYAIGNCYWEMPTGFVVHPVGPTNTAPKTGSIGLRHCRCTAAHENAAQREAACRSPAEWSCDVGSSLYASGTAPWRAMATPSSTPVTFDNSSVVPIAWDSVADLEAIGTGSLPPPPWAPTDGLVGNARLDGIVWAHAIGGGDLASSYAPADHRFRQIVHWKKIPQYAPALWWEYCGNCGVEMPWLSILDRVQRIVIGIGPDGARQITLAGDVIDLISKGRVLAAVEPSNLLARAGIERRALVVNTAGAVLGAITNRHGASIEPYQRPALAGTDTARVYAYSALRGELYAVRLMTGNPTARIERLTTRWESVASAGVKLGTPLAATVDPSTSSLYIIDRYDDNARLVRVDLVADRATIVSPKLFATTPSTASISMTPAGEVLVAAGREFAWIADGKLRGRASATDPVTGEIRELASGVHFAGAAGAGFVPARARKPPTGSGITPAF